MTTIRQATEQDLPALLAIYNDIILRTTAVYDYEPHSIDMRRAWYKAKLEAGYPVFVAVSGGRLVGFSSFGPFRAWAAYQFTVENSVYVAEDQRGKGIGRALLPPLLEAARQKGLHTMVAGIDATNEASLRLHRAAGFQEVGTFREVGFKFGRWLDLTFLQRDL